MQEFICKLPENSQLAIILTVQLMIALLEYWLGKTPKTESASIIELLINVLKDVFRRKQV